MPHAFYGPPPVIKPTSRELALQSLNAPEGGGQMDSSQMLQMLAHLYGIQQAQTEAPEKQRQLALANKLAELNLSQAPGKEASEESLRQAQAKHLGQDKLPSNFQFLTPEQQNFVFGQTYPEFGEQQAQVAADKLAKQQAQDAEFARQKAGIGDVGGVPSEGLGAGIRHAITGFPSWLQGVDTGMTDKGMGFWQGLTGYQPDSAKEDEAKQFFANMAKEPNQPIHDPIGNWVSDMYGRLFGPKGQQTPQNTPTQSQQSRMFAPQLGF